MKSGIIYVLITALCFTTHEPVTKLFASEINPYAITAIRFFIGSLILLPFSVREIIKKHIKLTVKDFLIMGGLGILSVCISMIFVQMAVDVADSPALVAIVFSSNSIITIILSVIFLGDKLTKKKIAGLCLCICGVLVSADLSRGSNMLSILLALLSAVTFSIYTVLCKKYMTKISGIIQTGLSFFIGSVALLVVLALLGIEVVGGISSSNITELLYISIVVTGVGYWAYFSAVKTGGPQNAAITFLIKPILTPVATFFINGIAPNENILIALVLVLVGAVLASGVQMRGRKKGVEIQKEKCVKTSADGKMPV